MVRQLLVAAGGTGGHLYPALSLIETIWAEDPQIDVTLVTSDASHDADLLRQYGGYVGDVRVATLPIRARTSRSPLVLLRFGIQLVRSWWRATRLIAAERPQVIVGFGSYVSAPVVLAGWLAGCRIVLHEQNVIPGQANRWLAPLADCVAVSCAATQAQWTGRARRVLTGNPIRAIIGAVKPAAARRIFDLSPELPTLLVLGGSRGARAINHLMTQAVSLWSPAERAACQIVHLAGVEDAAGVERMYAQVGIAHRVLAFCDQMAEAYAAADLVLARAGATTLSELAAAGRPAVLMPYPYGNGHQRANVRWWVDAGAAICFEERATTPGVIADGLITTLRDPVKLQRMRAQASSLARPEAAHRLAGEVFALAGWTMASAPTPVPVFA